MNLFSAEELAISLMTRHGLIWANWKFKFDRSVKRLGLCKHKEKIISLGQHATLVNDETAVRNTILHEIAHALVGSWEGHGPVWKAKAKEIGCNGDRLGNIAIKAPYKYQLSCNDCGYIWHYYRKPTLGPCYIHKCKKLLARIGFVTGQPWKPVNSNLFLEALA